MKILFLDHDGVICLSNNWGSRFKKTKGTWTHRLDMPLNERFDNFDKKAIKVLNQVLIQTDCEIVVTSDWRTSASLEEMGDYYQSQEILKRPLDYTTTILSTSFDFDPQFDLEQTRSLEILEWLKDHPEVTNWVAVDDLDMSNNNRNWGLSNFVHTPNSNEGIKKLSIKEKLLKFLL
jgi:hypothetical protein